LQNYVITNVEISTLSNNSATNSCGTNGYTDYTNIAAPDIYIGETLNLSVTAGTYTCNALYGMAWFDFNRNGYFGDPGEAIYLGEVASGSTKVTAITIPPNASVGTVRMRIKLLQGAVLSSWFCFTNSTLGETEDYNVNLICPDTPFDVTGKFPSDGTVMVCGASVALRWNPSTCADGFKVYMDTDADPTTLVSTQTGTTFVESFLDPSTTYYWKIVPYNSNGDGASSVWSFTTNTTIVPPISMMLKDVMMWMDLC
jgi:hypothetical protein